MHSRIVRPLLSASFFVASLFTAFAAGDAERGKYLGEAGLTKFLETSLGSSGHAAAPPMPAYKMKAADARDITAYLKSLK